MAAAPMLSMKVKNTFIDIDVEHFSDEFLNGYVRTGPGCVARQMSEPAPSTTKYLLCLKAEPHMEDTSASGSLEEPDMEDEASMKGSVGDPCERMMEEADCCDAARPGEMLPPQWPLGRMERQVIGARQTYEEMPRQVTEECWAMWGTSLCSPGATFDLQATELNQKMQGEDASYLPSASPDFSGFCQMLSPGCMIMPYGMTPSTEDFVPVGALTMPEASVQQSAAPVDTPIKGVSDEWAEVRTIVIRNLPNKYTQQLLIEEINSRGFADTFDFLYLPIDPSTDANRGYAFVNFADTNDALRFKAEFDGRQMARFDSSKFVVVMPAALQGFDANYAHYSNARVNRGDPARRPLFLHDVSVTANKSKRRGGRRHGKSLIDIALRAKEKKAAAAKLSTEVRPTAVPAAQPSPIPRVVLPPSHGGSGNQIATGGTAVAQSLTESAAAKFCPMCGGKRSTDDRFCAFCGSTLA
eukprot:gnl/TRDRNA2_/TRDRNA2_84418_c0_seq3.p1 gnl/TRDRNA2_/TRDRNA2_84418_c0~~gnl/TRDRNA2_/TRDRNA2_84418_c0_seq3.p1  ORF type:complete len:469 (-),score=94.35 gnl/TRDRNA2_/TRDRNA2_84418_c0_seq3:1233-2639(-)